MFKTKIIIHFKISYFILLIVFVISVELLENANYLELFIMSSFGENRSHVKILNQFDPCCFYGTSYKLFEDEIKSSLSKMENGHFEIHIDSETRKHEISNESLDYIINNLKLNNRS